MNYIICVAVGSEPTRCSSGPFAQQSTLTGGREPVESFLSRQRVAADGETGCHSNVGIELGVASLILNNIAISEWVIFMH